MNGHFFAQFRCGILPLRIETGRYVGESPDERLCRFSDSQNVENEVHFLLNCSLYTDIRNECFSDQFNTEHFRNLSDTEQLGFIVHNHPRKVTTFIGKAYLRRRATIYH